jgi:hypothetical protein
MQKFVVVVVLLGLFSLPLMAQKAEVFGGYQYLRLNNIGDSNSGIDVNANGWDTSLTGYFNKFFGLTGDFSGAYATFNVPNKGNPVSVSGHTYTYSGGPVIAFREGPVHPFVHVLFGGVHEAVTVPGGCNGSCSQNGFTTMFGGGVDVRVNKAIAVRIAEFDWVYYNFSSQIGGGSSYSESGNVRITTGIVLRF